jgi:hypothetical protein
MYVVKPQTDPASTRYYIPWDLASALFFYAKYVNNSLVDPNMTFDEGSNLEWYCVKIDPKDKPDDKPLTPESWIDGQKEIVTKVAPPGGKVVFTHEIRKNTPSEAFAPDGNIAGWQINETGNHSGQPDSATSTCKSLAGHNFNNASFNAQGKLTTLGDCTNVEFNVPADAPEGSTWCQSIKYTYLKDGQEVTDESTPVCVRVIREDPTPGGSCPLDGSYGYIGNIDQGKTVGRSAVQNLTHYPSATDRQQWPTANDAGSATTPTAKSASTVWAKPGDQVIFNHTLCPGAQAVTTHAASGDPGYPTPARNHQPVPVNNYSIRFTTHNKFYGVTLPGSNNFTDATFTSNGTVNVVVKEDPNPAKASPIVADTGKTIRQQLNYDAWQANSVENSHYHDTCCGVEDCWP